MLSKQKSYVPRFALILNCLWTYDSGYDFYWVNADIMKKAEKLSNYFIAMSKKIKIDMIENMELRDVVRDMKGSPTSEIIKAVYAMNPEFNKSELAELLNVTRQTIYKHIKK